MTMTRVAVIALFCGVLIPHPSQAWTRSYVVESFEPAMLYRGGSDGTPDSPGPDCANGFPDTDWNKLLVTSYRSRQWVEELANPDNGRRPFVEAIGFRGPNRETVYENPTLAPEGKLIEVTSDIAEGFDLDGDTSTGFLSPDGRKGVDNAFYKVSGCLRRFRGPVWEAEMSKLRNEVMRSGEYSVVFVMSGEGSPLNDDDVTVGVFMSDDPIVKDQTGGVASEYTYRIIADPALRSVFKATIKAGVLETKGPAEIRSYDLGVKTASAPIVLHKAQARFQMSEDGPVTGLIGGYRDWFAHYQSFFVSGTEPFLAASGEVLGRHTGPDWYYALRRRADGLPDPVTGQMRGISTTYRYRLVPAFVIDPAGAHQVTRADVPIG